MAAYVVRIRKGLGREEVTFPLRFLAWAFLLWWLFDNGLPSSAMRGLQVATSGLVVQGASLTGLSAVSSPQAVITFAGGRFAYHISEGCTAWAPILLYVAAVLAYQASWRQRGRGVLIGVPLVLGLNIVRLVSMAWLGVAWPAVYEQAHGFWWQAFVIAAVGLGWLAWARYIETERRTRETLSRWKETGLCAIVFLAAVTGLEAFGAAWGLIHAYGSLLVWLGEAWTGALGVGGPLRLSSADFEYSLLYGSLAAAIAMYLAIPNVPVRRKLIGAACFGMPAQVVLDAVLLGLRKAIMAGAVARPHEASLLHSILVLGGAALVWHVWARRQRPAQPNSARFNCPACEACLEGAAKHHGQGLLTHDT